MKRAVVFAYHDVGVRCLSVLLAHGVDVRLVVTHEDNPREAIWFESVAGLARLHGIPVATPEDPNTEAFVSQVQAAGGELAFSFYYRAMLGPALLDLFRGRAYNLHGSLLPKYRGRVPVNWAIINGERTTGATLHEMVTKPDAGAIVDQMAVPILPNDLAIDVFRKVTAAAEIVLDRSLASLLAGAPRRTPQDLAQGSYYGGRRPEDGRIDWRAGAWALHNLVRAVAPPYPGAFGEIRGRRIDLLRTYFRGERGTPGDTPALYVAGDRVRLACADGGVLTVVDARIDGAALTAANFKALAKADRLQLLHE